MSGIAIGYARIESCMPDGHLNDDHLFDTSPGGAMTGCARIAGGPLSRTFMDVLGVVGGILVSVLPFL